MNQRSTPVWRRAMTALGRPLNSSLMAKMRRSCKDPCAFRRYNAGFGVENAGGVSQMARNSELIRQWKLLQKVAAVRGNTIPKLATDLDVSTRTVRRDLDALPTAGFPVFDETVNGTKFWRMDAKAPRALARIGLTFSELAALYFSRALLACFAGTHLLRDVQGAFVTSEAAERIRRASVQEDTFEPVAELDSDPYGGSLGVHRGPTSTVKLRLHSQVAASVKERMWHASQQIKDRPDGSVVMTLEVSDDYALRSWILGFGRFVRVLAPAHLVEWVRDELDQSREQYASGEMSPSDSDAQASLPFLFDRLASA